MVFLMLAKKLANHSNDMVLFYSEASFRSRERYLNPPMKNLPIETNPPHPKNVFTFVQFFTFSYPKKYNILISDIKTFKLIKQNLIKLPKAVNPTNSKTLLKTLETSVINSPLSPPSLYFNGYVINSNYFYLQTKKPIKLLSFVKYKR